MPQGAYYAGDRTFRVAESAVVAPSDGEVTVDIAYCGVCGTDLHIYRPHGRPRRDAPGDRA
jgi:threonine dehydrogenase-like Zn-dependent dehydrogenase